MPNRVRGIRQSLPANVLIGRLNGAGGPAQAITLDVIANAIAQRGAIPLSAGNFITSVDANFNVVSGELEFHTIASGDLIANSGASTAEPTATTLPALIDRVYGNGTADYVFTADGSGGQSWQPGGGGGYTAKGAWNGLLGYSPDDVVTYNGSAYLNYSAISAPASGISLDGHVSSAAHTASATCALTTAGTNDIIIVIVQAINYSATPTVVSVSDASSLTWARRASYPYTPSFPNANGYNLTEIWWAHAPSALASDTITVAMGETDYVCLTAFGLNGAASLTSPFDADGSLTATNSSGGPSSPNVTGVSSDNPNDAYVFFTQLTGVSAAGWTGTPPTGFSVIENPFTGGSTGAMGTVFGEHIVTMLSGATITSGDSDSFWSSVLDVIDGGALPNTPPDTDDSHWLSQGKPAAAGGLYSQVMSTTPTSASTGLTTWLNQGGSGVSDSAVGVCINTPSSVGANIAGRYKTAPATPYTVTALVARTSESISYAGIGIGWYDGSAMLQVISLVDNLAGPAFIEVESWNSVSSFNTANYSGQKDGKSQPIWFQIEDDGTSVYFRFSNDGANFLEVYSTLKASGFLSSYADVIFFANPQGGQVLGTLMSYAEG